MFHIPLGEGREEGRGGPCRVRIRAPDLESPLHLFGRYCMPFFGFNCLTYRIKHSKFPI
jgi:hypothetical protein